METLNVAPVARKYPSVDVAGLFEAVDLYSPDAVDVRRATGGFSSVVEISAPYCLRMYASQLESVQVVAQRSGSLLDAELEPLLPDLVDPWWQSFTPAPNDPFGIGYLLEPRELRFPEHDRVTVSFEGTLALYQRALPPTPPKVPPPRFPIDVPHVIPEVEGPTPWPQPALVEREQPLESTSRSGPPSGAALIGMAAPPLRAQRVVGSIKAELSAGLRWVGHPSQKSVDIYLDLREAELKVEPDAGDATTLYDAFLAGLIYRAEALVAPVTSLPLTPTISVVGRNAANAAVPELPDFDVRVFPVDGMRDRQAVCAAFDLVPGCAGIVEDVEHFVGDSDYGVIRDEYSIERVLHHKWNRGGFDRSVGIARRVTLRVRRDGQERDEDATVYGRLQLESLDTVALEPDPDLRRDFLAIGGRAQGIADRVVLVADGTTVTPANADLGPPAPVPWGVNLDTRLLPTWSSDPELRQFQQRAHSDGVRHLSRPFARQPEYGGADVSYIRTEAVQKRLFVLGSLSLFH